MEDGACETTGGLRILLRTYRPARSPRGIVVIVHGFNSHGGYYTWLADQLVASGLTVYVLDLLGRDRSDGERFYVDSFTHSVDDVTATVERARTNDSTLPIFLLGHGVGGVVACLYAIEHQEKLTGLICESFAFQVPAPDFALTVVKGVRHLAPLLELKNEHAVAAMVLADERFETELSRLTLPLLILHGTADKATSLEGSRRFFDDSRSRDKQLTLYARHVHDLLDDDGREQVLGDIFGWLEERLPWTA